MTFVKPETHRVVEAAWAEIPLHSPGVHVDAFVVMPNHIHGILVLTGSDASDVVSQHAGKLRRATALGTVVRSFKAAVTRELRIRCLHDERPVWQPSFYDRVVRDNVELNRIREYIAHNPVAWRYDRENPERTANEAYERTWGWLERPVAGNTASLAVP